MRYFVFLLAATTGFSLAAGLAPAQTVPPEFSPPSLEDLPPAPEDDAIDVPAPAVEGEDKLAQELDKLFTELKAAEKEGEANRIAAQIQRLWLKSGSPTVDLLMARSAAAMKAEEYGLALDLLDTVTRLEPEYAEGWNRRATVYYLQENFGRSLTDIERVLALEPRHWGAISGLGIILRRLDKKEEALATFKKVLELNPMSANARKAVEDLEAETAGEAI
ncbi:tetratricopeptide repeat protein [Rhizobiales bacterium]|uniref:tetratricopeptide repeat protein n=1 Tax=Hongsoonwoonella zoysiae TaxID=2821844 RepID=UPI0015608EA9|nr:tetratricopeptide repeat protein [Hongsoonwoonella zoysiae]NRG17321.1 tetratricopeptide repeat protein [Hongsoonwoonella zoysiae]